MAAQHSMMAIGLMVGTSLDGIDAALVQLGDDDSAELRGYVTKPLDPDVTARLRAVAEGTPCSAAEWAGLGVEVAQAHAAAARSMAAGALRAGSIALVAAHGVTVSHVPRGATPHSTQVLDGAALAAELGVPVVCDFRSADVARGGEGAPLAPLADLALRTSATRDRVILNLGGIANLTALPAGATRSADIRGGDVGPANLVLDECCRRASGGEMGYDQDGALARVGTADAVGVETLLGQAWVRAPLPRSFGREEFGPAWVDAFEVATAGQTLSDRLATLVQVEARAVDVFLREVAGPWRKQSAGAFELYVTGGGRHNLALMDALQNTVEGAEVRGMEDLGVDPDAKEAMDFAWLGGRALRGVVSDTAALTGARANAVLGLIHPVAGRSR